MYVCIMEHRFSKQGMISKYRAFTHMLTSWVPVELMDASIHLLSRQEIRGRDLLMFTNEAFFQEKHEDNDHPHYGAHAVISYGKVYDYVIGVGNG